MTARRRAGEVPPPPRDTDATPFTPILDALLGRLPGAFAAALVDQDGETVDYAGAVEPFDVKVAAAHARIVLHDLERFGALGKPEWLVVRGSRRTLMLRALPDAYALAVLLRRRAGFSPSRRALSACIHALAAEAGWPPSTGPAPWFSVAVTTNARGRPTRVFASEVDVFGAVVGLPRGEKGFRVRTAEGHEATLVREPGNHWYADAAFEDTEPRTA